MFDEVLCKTFPWLSGQYLLFKPRRHGRRINGELYMPSTPWGSWNETSHDWSDQVFLRAIQESENSNECG